LHPAVLEAAVIGVPDPKWGEVPKAFVTLKPGLEASSDDQVAFARQHLARFKVPKSIAFGPLPKTSTGKLQKGKVGAQERVGHDERTNGARPGRGGPPRRLDHDEPPRGAQRPLYRAHARADARIARDRPGARGRRRRAQGRRPGLLLWPRPRRA